jgi:hypothetical protein
MPVNNSKLPISNFKEKSSLPYLCGEISKAVKSKIENKNDEQQNIYHDQT